MNKISYLIGGIILGGTVVAIGYSIFGGQGSEIERATSFVDKKIVEISEISCSIPQTTNATALNGIITHVLPAPESVPIRFTFSDLTSESGKISFIDGTNAITSSDVVQLPSARNDQYLLADINPNYTAIFGIDLTTGVLSYSKQLSFMGAKSVTAAIGTCVGY